MLLIAILIPGYERECNLGSSLKVWRTLGYGCSEAQRPKEPERWGSRTGGKGFCTNESKQTRIFPSVLPRLVPGQNFVCILFCFLIFLVLKNNPLLFVLFFWSTRNRTLHMLVNLYDSELCSVFFLLFIFKMRSSLNSPCSSGWSWTCNPPASGSQVAEVRDLPTRPWLNLFSSLKSLCTLLAVRCKWPSVSKPAHVP